jgi:putative membrane protein
VSDPHAVPGADEPVAAPDDPVAAPDDPDVRPPLADGEVVAPRPARATSTTAPRGPLALVGTFAIGFGMGTADIVPGFSGGTVALVTGIYERLVANIRQGARILSLGVRGRFRDAVAGLLAIEWSFIVTLLAGILTAIAVLASALSQLLRDEPVVMSALFLGLVLGASVLAARELRQPAGIHVFVGLAAAVITFAGLGASSGTVVDPPLFAFFAAAAVAICAMILPGVSGSFLLLLLGMYLPVIDAVEERDLVVLAIFGLGAVVGLASFSTLLNWLLRRWHDLVLAVLIGLMVGSVRVLWPWPAGPDGVGGTALGAPVADEVPAALAAGLGALVVVLLLGAAGAKAASRRERRR